MPVGMVPEGGTVASLSDYSDVRGSIEPEVKFNKRWGSGVK